MSEVKDRIKHLQNDSNELDSIQIDLQKIDAMVLHELNEEINIKVMNKGTQIKVSAEMYSQERWKRFQMDGFNLDERNHILTPLMIVKKNSVSETEDMRMLPMQQMFKQRGMHLDYVFRKRKDNTSSLSQFDKTPTHKQYRVVIPKYITIDYTLTMIGFYTPQVNTMFEKLLMYNHEYWGNDYMKFKVDLSTMSFDVEQDEDSERIVKGSVDMTLKGYIIPEGILEFKQRENTINKVNVTFKEN